MAEYTLPDLPYDYAALEPHVSAQIMELHHDKHHAAYVTGANQTLEKLAAARDKEIKTLDEIEYAILERNGEISIIEVPQSS